MWRRLLIGVPAALAFACVALSVSPRLAAVIAVPFVLAFHVAAAVTGRPAAHVLLLWGLFAVLCLQPLDVTLVGHPRGPRFMRVAYGLPSRETLEAARRGEVYLGGCIRFETFPTWVWVWHRAPAD
jgi:hypothetical protein